MATLSRFSTSTIVASNGLVPWLAARGPSAYSPLDPPARDYFFQYSWILPGVFDPRVKLREHRYFGRYRKDGAKFLFDFWGNARKGCGATLQQYCELGHFPDSEVRAPLAAYHHVRKNYDTAGSLLIQHGSYQWISCEDQPHIDAVRAGRSYRCESGDRPEPDLCGRRHRLPGGIHPSIECTTACFFEVSC